VKLSIIIPTLNEASTIGRLIERLLTQDNDQLEIIIVDGGSTDGTVEICATYPVQVVFSPPSRAKQLNLGAQIAKHNTLYFVHADTLPPKSFYTDCQLYLNGTYAAACYRAKFEGRVLALKLNAFFTRFNWLISRGGDQSLFIGKKTFLALGKFDEEMEIMEEYPLLSKLMDSKKLAVIPKTILISTRKYENRSWLKVSRANAVAFKMFKAGVDSKEIKQKYLELLG
jgi:rSAM/selenodomain-associated transferase 2